MEAVKDPGCGREEAIVRMVNDSRGRGTGNVY